MTVGDILYCNIPFANGTTTDYPRYFVVIETGADNFHCLNLSSVKGKESKLAFSSNKEIFDCIPPMFKRTMVKLDEEYTVPNSDKAESKIRSKFSEKIISTILRQEKRYKKRPDTRYQHVNSNVL